MNPSQTKQNIKYNKKIEAAHFNIRTKLVLRNLGIPQNIYALFMGVVWFLDRSDIVSNKSD